MNNIIIKNKKNKEDNYSEVSAKGELLRLIFNKDADANCAVMSHDIRKSILKSCF